MTPDPTSVRVLRYCDLRFDLTPERRLDWPSERRGTMLRGAFGLILKDIACDPLCSDPARCEFAAECVYEQLFAPVNRPGAQRLSLNQDLPRPFVLIPEDNDPETIEAGGHFSFVARMFGETVALHPYMTSVFSRLMQEGFGHDRVRCNVRQPASPLFMTRSLSIPADTSAAEAMEIRFLTPAFLKHEGREVRAGREAFAPLVKRTRDRLSSLYHFYEPGAPELDWDFSGIGKMAEQAICIEDRTRWIEQQRRSTRTGQTHDLSGLTGSAVYRNVPEPLQHLLQTATLTHVGKHAAFGLGRIAVRQVDR
jgi:CRISPR-associated endoribonuclease Cas6